MKIICTTSDRYLHILPIFCHLFNKFWSDKQQVEIVGYNHPNFKLPTNFNFVSLGNQTPDKQNFTRDLRKYFAKQDKFFIWMMEDTFLKGPVDFKALNQLKHITNLFNDVGRINLTGEVLKQDHEFLRSVGGYDIFCNNKFSLYRLSTQVSIWNKHFALQYMVEDLSPWEFECQSDHAIDEFLILGMNSFDSPVRNNEGVRKHNIYDFNFDGIPEEVINEMKSLKFI